MPLEHQIIKNTRQLLIARTSRPLTAETIPQGYPKDPAGVADYLIRAYLGVSRFDFSKETLVGLASFAVYRPDRSRTIIFDRGMEPADRIAHILHALGHIHLAPLPRRHILVRTEQRNRMIAPEYLPIEEAADEWAQSFSEQIVSNADPNNLLTQGLKLGSERIAFLGRI